MSGPVGFSTSEKKLEFGWSEGGNQDQFLERLRRNIAQLEGEVHHQFAWDPDGSFGLSFAYFGGIVDSSAAWIVVPAGTLTLPDNTPTIYIERVLVSGAVTQNLAGWTYPTSAPIAEVTTKAGNITDVIDRRPHDVAGGGGGGGGGCTTFPCLLGQILDAQVPASAVIQHEALLTIAFTQITGIATKLQLPVSIAYEDEINIFTEVNNFANQVRRGIATITVVDSPYTWLSSDWHLNANPDLGAVEVLVPAASSHHGTGRTDQLHIKHSGQSRGAVTLTPQAGELIDGYDCAILREPNLCFTLVSDGSNWWIQ